MGTRERLAEHLERLERLVPGMGSYKDKEERRDADKRLRTTLARRLDTVRKAVEEVVYRLQAAGYLDHSDRLGRLERRLHKAADAIRFASYGFTGIFDGARIDEAKLDELYAFDVLLAESVSTVEQGAARLKALPPEAIGPAVLEPLEQDLASFDSKMEERAALFTEA
jgi:hypothetical protein